MNSHYLVILSLMFPLPSIGAQATPSSKGVSLVKTVERNHEWQVDSNVQGIKYHRNDTSLQGTENGETTNLRSWKGPIAWHHRHHLRSVRSLKSIHKIIIIIKKEKSYASSYFLQFFSRYA